MAVNYGSKRTVVGAGYGMRDWLAQRITAALMALFTFAVLIQWLLPQYVKDFAGEYVTRNNERIAIEGYQKWAGIFSNMPMKFLTFAVAIALIYHVWVGVRDIFMDYIKPVGLRLALQVATIVWLLGCAGWIFQVLWSI